MQCCCAGVGHPSFLTEILDGWLTAPWTSLHNETADPMTRPPTMPAVPREEAIEYLGFTIHLRQTELEWMAMISGSKQRPSIVLAADREAVLAKARQWIEAHPATDTGRQ